MMNGTLYKTSHGNDSLPDARATARVASTRDDNLAMPPATGYGRSDSCGRAGSPFHTTPDTPAPQDLFATTPMKAMQREFYWQREEETYASFEAAISNRVLALKERRIHTHVGTGASESITPSLRTVASAATTIWHTVCSMHIRRRGILFVVLALVLMLVGFDLMGLLILYAR